MGGFSCDRFVDPLSDNLKCGICLQVFDNAVITDCGHTYCYDCIKQCIQMSGRKECPECRQSVATRISRSNVNDNNTLLIGTDIVVTKNRLINAMVSKLRVKCDLAFKGCPEVIVLESMATHLKTCRFTVCQTCGIKDMKSGGNHNCIESLKIVINDWNNVYKKVETERNSLKQKTKQLETNVKTAMDKISVLEAKCKEWELKYKRVECNGDFLIRERRLLETKANTSMERPNLNSMFKGLRHEYGSSGAGSSQPPLFAQTATQSTEPDLLANSFQVWQLVFEHFQQYIQSSSITDTGITLTRLDDNVQEGLWGYTYDHNIPNEIVIPFVDIYNIQKQNEILAISVNNSFLNQFCQLINVQCQHGNLLDQPDILIYLQEPMDFATFNELRNKCAIAHNHHQPFMLFDPLRNLKP